MPSASTLNKYYQGFLFNAPNVKDINKEIELKRRDLVSLFNFTTDRRNFLDCGGGMGSSYKAACELNLNVYYHDLDKEAESFVISNYGLSNKFVVDDLSRTSLTFDYIFSDNVIEHVICPINFVKELFKSLNASGEIVIKTPHVGNTESYFDILQL